MNMYFLGAQNGRNKVMVKSIDLTSVNTLLNFNYNSTFIQVSPFKIYTFSHIFSFFDHYAVCYTAKHFSQDLTGKLPALIYERCMLERGN